MSGLARYAVEVRGIADEFRDFLHGTVKAAAFSVLSSMGEDGLLNMTDAELQKALKLLSQTPSQRDKTLARLDDKSAATLIMRARYLGLCSAQTLALADRFSQLPGASYRDAAERGARASFGLKPSMSEVLPGWRGPGQNDDDDVDDNGYGRRF